MAISVVGSASAAATSVAIPAHAAGDMIIVFARGTASLPSIPAAGGTVPTWTTMQGGSANSLATQVSYCIATATNHTTGTWTNATHICVLVLRPGAGKILAYPAAGSSVGNANNTQSIVYPALTLGKTDGTSMGVRIGTRTVAITAVGTAPSGWTNQVIQPAGASALMAVHTRAALTVNPTADTVTTTSSNAASRAMTIEVQENSLAPTLVPVTAVASAQAFGALVLQPGVAACAVGGVPSAQAFGGVRQFAPVGCVYPYGFVASICGQPTCGDGHICYGVPGGPAQTIVGQFKVGDGHLVGGDPYPQFGVVTATVTTTITAAVGGVASPAAFGVPSFKIAFTAGSVPSAQSFGTPTVTAVITRAVGAVSSAQAFGSPTVVLAAVHVSVGGVSSASAFGAITVKTVIAKPAGGVSTAQAFGAPTIKAVVTVAVGAVSSAQSFGTLRFLLTRAVGGVSSAQAFGVPSIKLTVAVGAVSSAQSFGIVTVKAAISKPAGGVASAQAFGTLTIKTTITRTLVGLGSAQAFGSLTIVLGAVHPGGVPSAQAFGTVRVAFVVHGGGVSSAQAFGTPSARSITRAPLGGVASAQAFGQITTIVVYLYPLVCLTSPNLALCGLPICGDGTICGGEPFLSNEECIPSPAAAILGEFIVGDGTVVGGEPFLLNAPTSTLVLSALATNTLDLQAASSTSIDLEPAGVR